MDSVSLNVFKLEMNQGHLRWKVSDLARSSKVSRPLIYYYFGKTKKEIFESSFKMVCDEIYCFSAEKVKQMKAGNSVKAIMSSRKLINENYALQVFTHRWRYSKTHLEKALVDYELRAEEKLQKQFPQYSKKQIKLVHVSLHGLLTAPFIAESDVKELLHLIFKDSKYFSPATG